MKKKLRLKPLAKSIIVVIVLELILISYLFLCSNRIVNIEKNKDTNNVSVYLWR